MPRLNFWIGVKTMPSGGDVEQLVQAPAAVALGWLDALGPDDRGGQVGLAVEGLRELVVEVVGVGDADDRRVAEAPSQAGLAGRFAVLDLEELHVCWSEDAITPADPRFDMAAY